MPQAKNLLLMLLLSLFASQAAAESLFTHAIIRLPFEVRVEEAWSQIITSQAQWQQFYTDNRPPIFASPSPLVAPEVDFSEYIVVVGGLGVKYSHTNIVVEKVSAGSTDINLSIALVSPGSTCTVTTEAKYPNIAVLLPKPAGELTIYTQEYFHECLK